MSTYILNLLCGICTEIFKTDDDICSTGCGHVFHHKCLSGWLDRSKSCPKCRGPNPSTYKLYLNFNESAEIDAKIKSLEDKLNESSRSYNKLKIEFVVEKKNFTRCQDYQKIESETLKKTITDLEDVKSTLTNEIMALKSSYAAEITEMKREHLMLKNDLKCSKELLDKEISKSDLLSAECIRLQSELADAKEKMEEVNSSQTKLLEGKTRVIQEQSNELASLSETLTTLRTSNAEDITRLKDEISKLRNDLNCSTKRLKEEVSKSDRLSADCTHLQVALSEAKDDATKARSSQTTLLEEKTKVTQKQSNELASLSKALLTLKSSYAIETAKLKNEILKLRNDLKCSTERLEKEVSKNDRLSADCTHLQVALSEAKHNTTKSPQAEILKEKFKFNQKLSNELTLRTEELKSLKSSSAEVVSDLEYSTKQLEKEAPESDLLSAECTNLRVKLGNDKENNNGAALLQIAFLKERNKLLEQKLGHIMSEFEKEISKCTQLEIDKIKLQSYIDHMRLNSSLECETIDHISNKRHISQKSKFDSSSESLNSIESRRDVVSSSNSVIIQNHPLEKLQNPLENAVIFLALQMGIVISISDIDKVNVVGGEKVDEPKKEVSLFVRFKTRKLKFQFLRNKSRLKDSAVAFLTMVKIKEHIVKKPKEVYEYAREKLVGNGFDDVSWTNNQIIAKRKLSDWRGLRITTCGQVDDLVKKTEALGN